MPLLGALSRMLKSTRSIPRFHQRYPRHIGPIPRSPSEAAKRSFTGSSSLGLAKKDSQNKDDLKPRKSEYSESDDKVAGMEKTAFNPNESSPEKEIETAKQESGQDGNPLDVSPANKNLNKPKDEEGKTGQQSRPSGGGGNKEKKRLVSGT